LENSPELTPNLLTTQEISDRGLVALKWARVSSLSNLPVPGVTLLRDFSPPEKLCYVRVLGVPFSWAVPTLKKPLRGLTYQRYVVALSESRKSITRGRKRRERLRSLFFPFIG